MCGFYAKIGSDLCQGSLSNRQLEILSQRGPHCFKSIKSSQIEAYLARLAILNLAGSDETLFIECVEHKYTLFNGEIYNYERLVDMLVSEGVVLNHYTESEVITKGLEYFGNRFLLEIDGMYSFVIIDSRDNTAVFARDILGIKPLYMADLKEGLVLSSQIRIIVEDESFLYRADFDKNCIDSIRVFGSSAYYSSPWKSIKECAPGVLYEFNGSSINASYDFGCTLWNRFLTGATLAARKSSENRTDFWTRNKNKLVDAVTMMYIHGDIKKGGIFASGGKDSALLLAILHKYEPSLQMIVSDERSSEVAFQKKLVAQFDLSCRYFFSTKKTHKEFRKQFISDRDSISIDGANIWLASKQIKEEGVRYVLTGLGGDEVFMAYPSYLKMYILFIFSSLGSIPLRLSCMISGKPFFKFSKNFLNFYFIVRALKYERVSGCRSFEENIERVFSEQIRVVEALWKLKQYYKAFAFLDLIFYTRSQLLKDADWASMAHSIELRPAFLSNQVLEMFFSQPCGRWPILDIRSLLFGLISGFKIRFGSKKGFTVGMKSSLRFGSHRDELNFLFRLIGSRKCEF